MGKKVRHQKPQSFDRFRCQPFIDLVYYAQRPDSPFTPALFEYLCSFNEVSSLSTSLLLHPISFFFFSFHMRVVCLQEASLPRAFPLATHDIMARSRQARARHISKHIAALPSLLSSFSSFPHPSKNQTRAFLHQSHLELPT